MEDTGDDNVEPDPHEWSSENVATFVRSLGTSVGRFQSSGCFQSSGDKVLELGVDDSVFCGLSLNTFQGVCGHSPSYDRMCEFTHNSTDHRDASVHNDTDRPQFSVHFQIVQLWSVQLWSVCDTMTQTDHSCTITLQCSLYNEFYHSHTSNPPLPDPLYIMVQVP
jgi:hypothetical protein